MEVAPGTSFLNRWLHAVYSSKLTPAQRDTLNAYAGFMNRQGTMRVPRKTIVEMTGRARQHVDKHISAARREGLLELAEPASRGRPACYRATVPSP